MNVAQLLLLLLALAASWLLGRRSVQGGKRPRRSSSPPRDYFIGLNYLLNDEPDEAIDTFIRTLEQNQDSLETSLALGTLLRRRGKVDKSIYVYEGLLQRSELAESEVLRVKLELIRSYTAAGLLDRSEALLEELGEAFSPEVRRQALALAINLYQLEKDWAKAGRAAEQLLRICPVREKHRIQAMASHFCCELAEEALAREDSQTARHFLKKAAQLHRGNVRVPLLLADMEMAAENHREAQRLLLRVRQQNPDFVPETVDALLECCQRTGSERQLRKLMQEGGEQEASASLVVGLADTLQRQGEQGEALDFLLGRLRRRPSLKVLSKALALMGRQWKDAREQENLLMFHEVLADYLRQRATYQCHNCGFEARSLHWQCPGCNEWGVVKPVTGIAGE